MRVPLEPGIATQSIQSTYSLQAVPIAKNIHYQQRQEKADISRVLLLQVCSGNHLSGMAIAGHLWRRTSVPHGSAKTRETQQIGAKNSHRPAVAALLPTGVYRANASRHCWWALTLSLRPTFAPLPVRLLPRVLSPSAVCFCGTILTVTRTGNFSSGAFFREPGLSSSSCLDAIASPPFPGSTLAGEGEIGSRGSGERRRGLAINHELLEESSLEIIKFVDDVGESLRNLLSCQRLSCS